MPPLNRYRLDRITTPAGEEITVDYRTDPCCRSAPPSEDADTTLCFPVRWTPSSGGYTSPILDWFNKYVVTQVTAHDNAVSQSPDETTTYTYGGHPAWHHDDDPITAAKYRTWGDFRGYPTVTTKTGAAEDGPVSQTVTEYLRGMDGDLTSAGGHTSSSVTTALGKKITDSDALAGFAYQTTTDTAAGGSADAQTINIPWLSAATATHAQGSGLPDLTTHFTGTATTEKRQLLASGSWRTAETDTTYSSTTGQVTAVDDKGQVNSSGTPDGSTTPEKCTKTSYAANTAKTITSLPDQVVTYSGPCSGTPSPSNILSEARTYYDGATTLGAIPGPNEWLPISRSRVGARGSRARVRDRNRRRLQAIQFRKSCRR